MAIDFEAEGLLEGAGDERARQARLDLLRTHEGEGFTLEELRRATRENRLALLPVERALAAEGPRHTQKEIAAEAGLDLAFMNEARRAVGAPAVEPDERVLTDEDRELALNAAALLRSGIDWPGRPCSTSSACVSARRSVRRWSGRPSSRAGACRARSP